MRITLVRLLVFAFLLFLLVSCVTTDPSDIKITGGRPQDREQVRRILGVVLVDLERQHPEVDFKLPAELELVPKQPEGYFQGKPWYTSEANGRVHGEAVGNFRVIYAIGSGDSLFYHELKHIILWDSELQRYSLEHHPKVYPEGPSIR